MKTTTTETQIQTIIAALAVMNLRPFRCESGDPKYNAQRNLSGKTHYVDDDTLRFHKSRITSSAHLHGGLLFRTTCSDALDMHNRSRGFRSVVHDVFGNVVYRPELQDAYKSTDAAINASNKESIDLLAHYGNAINEELKRREQSADELRKALTLLAA